MRLMTQINQILFGGLNRDSCVLEGLFELARGSLRARVEKASVGELDNLVLVAALGGSAPGFKSHAVVVVKAERPPGRSCRSWRRRTAG